MYYQGGIEAIASDGKRYSWAGNPAHPVDRRRAVDQIEDVQEITSDQIGKFDQDLPKLMALDLKGLAQLGSYQFEEDSKGNLNPHLLVLHGLKVNVINLPKVDSMSSKPYEQREICLDLEAKLDMAPGARCSKDIVDRIIAAILDGLKDFQAPRMRTKMIPGNGRRDWRVAAFGKMKTCRIESNKILQTTHRCLHTGEASWKS